VRSALNYIRSMVKQRLKMSCSGWANRGPFGTSAIASKPTRPPTLVSGWKVQPSVAAACVRTPSGHSRPREGSRLEI
jgi:hypothetical protein